MIGKLKRMVFVFAAAGIVLGGGVPALAGQGGGAIRIELDHAPDRAEALVFSEGRVEVSPVTMEKKDASRSVALVLLEPDPMYQRRFVTVVGREKTGQTFFSEVHELSNLDGDDPIAAFCSDSPRRAAHEQLPLLQQQAVRELISVRKKKRELMLERIRSELTPGVLDTLRAAEEAYGLSGTPVLSKDMPMDQLLWRLAAIQTMAQNRLPRRTQ